MIIEKTKTEGGFDYSIRCEFCGGPITETSYEFGMDCKNHCSEKEFKKMFNIVDCKEVGLEEGK